MRQNCICIQLYFHTYKQVSMYLYKHVKFLQFLRMEFSSFLLLGNPEVSLFLFFLSVLLPQFPFLGFYHHHPRTFSPLLLSSCYHIFPTQRLFNRQLILLFLYAVWGGRESETEDIYPEYFSVPAKVQDLWF